MPSALSPLFYSLLTFNFFLSCPFSPSYPIINVRPFQNDRR
nr:MAG TPA: hypothetical protein [Caudoviricetes sp.]